MRKFLSAAAFVGALAVPAVGHATNFDFAATGTAGGFSGSGTLITTPGANGSYLITGISGPGITGLIAPSGFQGNDNLLFPSATYLVDGSGFSFTDTQGNTGFMVELYANPQPSGYQVYLLDSDGVRENLAVTFTLTPSATAVTPEPSSLVLLGSGALGLAGLVRRRFIQA